MMTATAPLFLVLLLAETFFFFVGIVELQLGNVIKALFLFRCRRIIKASISWDG